MLVSCSATDALAGGGLVLSDDQCLLQASFYKVHFTAYQSESRGDEEFCRSLPDVGTTTIVLDYLHDSLREVPVDFRLIRDPTGLGEFVDAEDVLALGDLVPLTVHYQPPLVQADGSLNMDVSIAEPGSYIAVLTAGHPTKDKSYTAVLPLTVATSSHLAWVPVVLLTGATGGIAFIARQKMRRRDPVSTLETRS